MHAAILALLALSRCAAWRGPPARARCSPTALAASARPEAAEPTGPLPERTLSVLCAELGVPVPLPRLTPWHTHSPLHCALFAYSSPLRRVHCESILFATEARALCVHYTGAAH